MFLIYVLFFLLYAFCMLFLGEYREKKFVTFEKTNSFKRGGVRTVFERLVTIITVVKCLGA